MNRILADRRRFPLASRQSGLTLSSMNRFVWVMRWVQTLAAVLLCGCWTLEANGQGLPFDHWAEAYWRVITAAEPAAGERFAWPPSRQDLAAWLLKPHSTAWTPSWVRELLRMELRCELTAFELQPWDRWDIGLVGYTGPRPVAPSKRPSYWVFGEGFVHFSPSARAYLRVRATHDPAAVPSYTGIPRQKRRLGFNTAEADYAYGEVEGSWYLLRLGRFKQSWGPADERSPWISAWGPAYDGVYAALRYHGFRFHFFTAYLETVGDSTGTQDVHRYLAGHFLRYSNGRNFAIGTGEVTLYAGPFRPVSLAYLNPFMVHLEYEDNERTNLYHKLRNLDNWQLAFCAEWYPEPRLRLWGMWVIDDIQIDREKRPDATALRVGGSWRCEAPVPGIVEANYVRVGTWTYRHQELYINWVSRGLPLGWDGGSDVQEFQLAWHGFPWRGVLASAAVTYREQGELDIREDLYGRREFPWGWPFPSGTVEKTWEVQLSARYQPRYNVWLEGGLLFEDVRNAGHVPGEAERRWRGFLSLGMYLDFSVYPPKGTRDNTDLHR